MSRIPLLASLLTFLFYRILLYFTGDFFLSLSVFVLPFGMLILNFVLRRNLRYKKWFLSKLNFWLEKKEFSEESAISRSLLFEKVIEVIQESPFELVDQNQTSCEILCGTKVNVLTWGENLYIQLIEKEDEICEIRLTSVSLFGGTSWTRNESNFELFRNKLDESLTI
jgi:hypothetical protein